MKRLTPKQNKRVKIGAVAALGVLAFLLLGGAKDDPAASAATSPDCGLPGVEATGPLEGLLGGLDALNPLADAVGGAACLLDAGNGMSASVSFDGSTYSIVGQPHMKPGVQDESVRFVSYGDVNVKVEVLYDGEVAYSTDMTRGQAGLLVVEFFDGPGNEELRVTDSQAGTQTVVLA